MKTSTLTSSQRFILGIYSVDNCYVTYNGSVTHFYKQKKPGFTIFLFDKFKAILNFYKNTVIG